MILTVTPNPCVDKTLFLDALTPGHFLRARRYTTIAGGKGTNVARAVHLMGRAAQAFVVVGGHTGRHVVDMIEGDGVSCRPVWVASPTRTITTVLEEPIHRQTALFEPGSRVTETEYESILGAFGDAVRRAQIVCFCGTVSDPAIGDVYERLIPVAQDAGAVTVLDSHGPEFRCGVEAVPAMVKPNQAESEEFLGGSLDDDAARWRAVDRFHELGVELVVMSLGADGALVSRGSERYHARPPAIEEVNPVGSGDALVAGFAIGLLEGQDLPDMARLAVAMGTANAMSWDIGHFGRDDVARLVGDVQIQQR